MKKITLYRYSRPEGGVTVSPAKPSVEYSTLFRLVADEGMELTDGVNRTACTDTDSPDAWYEVKSDNDIDATTQL